VLPVIEAKDCAQRYYFLQIVFVLFDFFYFVVLFKCDFPGCPVVFHPLCIERNRMGFLRIRNGIKEVFCQGHFPPDSKLLPSGGWLDINEVLRLRFSLDKVLKLFRYL